jgi:GNAT superfamily N-acetyltransferase
MITFSEQRDIAIEQILPLYELNGWSSARKPDALHQALLNSHALVSAWDGDTLVGIGNAISDGFLVVYYPHLLVRPDYQGQGIGQRIMTILQQRYAGMQMQMLVADGDAIGFAVAARVAFYQKCGFTRAGQTQPMWIYDGEDH